MPAQLILAPVGAGKTERVIGELAQTLSVKPFAKAWALLASMRQERAFRQRLVEFAADRAVYFNVEFFSFYTLYARLLDSAGRPQRELDDLARRRLLRIILEQLRQSGQLELYQAIATKPGFVQIVAQFIYELKQNLIEPHVFERAAQAGSAKDRDLHRIYQAYQTMLQQHDLVDREGLGWLALDALAEPNAVGQEVELFIVDGYDQFNLLQTRLLAALAGRVQQMVITLPWLGSSGDAAGRRFEQARARLQAAFERAGQPLVIHELSSPAPRPPALVAMLDRKAAPRPADGRVRFIEAPDATQETAAVLRHVKRLLLNDCRPDDILIAVRDWAQYGAALAERGRAYGLPLALHYGEPLADNPAVIALLNLLLLPNRDYRWRDVLDVLRSPYFSIPGLDETALSAVARISQQRRVVSGRDAWLTALRSAGAAPVNDDEGDALEPVSMDAQLAEALANWFDALTPPPVATAAEYVAWLEQLIGYDPAPEEAEAGDEADAVGYTLNMVACVRRGHDGRDLAALAEFKRILRSFLAAQFLTEALGQEPQLTWEAFLTELQAAVSAVSVQRSPNRDGQVLVTTVADARGLPHRHVFLLGLSEGVFPAPAPEDYLYLDSERRQLAAAGVALETQAERSADESLFVEMVGLASETLTLSRPTVKDGKPWPESHLWREMKARVSDAEDCLERVRSGAVVPVAQAASLDEALLAVADGLNASQLDPQVAGVYNWLVEIGDAGWQQVRHGRDIELRRLSSRPHDQYAGRLQAQQSRAWVAERLGPGRVWSASQLNDLGMCGFRFFARRLLELEPLEEPEEGLDSAQFGTLHHDILERTYCRLGSTPIRPENQQAALRALEEAADEVFASAPERLGFRPSALWDYEQKAIRRRLRRLVERDFSESSPLQKAFAGEAERQPYRQEAAFELPLIELGVGDGVERLWARGRIDRMDRFGDCVYLVDYKTSSTVINKQEMQAGRNFQMLVYLLAAQRLLDQDPASDAPRQVAGGLFWHITRGQGETSEAVTLEDPAVTEGLARLAQHIQLGRAGDFAVQPSRLTDGRCSKNCAYSRLCRVSVTHRHKREAPDEPHA